MKITTTEKCIIDSVTLELSLEEALWIKLLCGKVAGNGNVEARLMNSELYTKLAKVLVGDSTYYRSVSGTFEVK